MSKDLIFLSYSRKDSEFAKKLTNDIKSHGGNIWMDQINITGGLRWDKAIEDALEQSAFLIAILSNSSIESHNVMDEVSFALEENKTIIPVLIENCKIPFRLRRFQYLDFLNDYKSGFTQLADLLELSPEKSGAISNEKVEVKQEKAAVQKPVIKKTLVKRSKPKAPEKKKDDKLTEFSGWRQDIEKLEKLEKKDQRQKLTKLKNEILALYGKGGTKGMEKAESILKEHKEAERLLADHQEEEALKLLKAEEKYCKSKDDYVGMAKNYWAQSTIYMKIGDSEMAGKYEKEYRSTADYIVILAINKYM